MVGHYFPFPSDKTHDSSSDPPEPQLSQIKISLIGLYYTAYLATHFMGARSASASEPRPDRSILLTGSMLSYRAIARFTDYCAAKAGVRGVFKSLRCDLRKECGVRINMLAPTFIQTPLTQPVFEATKERFAYAPMEHVVDAVLRVVSDSKIDGFLAPSFFKKMSL